MKPSGANRSVWLPTRDGRASTEGYALKRLKELEKENSRLKRIVADLTIDKIILKEVAEGKW